MARQMAGQAEMPKPQLPGPLFSHFGFGPFWDPSLPGHFAGHLFRAFSLSATCPVCSSQQARKASRISRSVSLHLDSQHVSSTIPQPGFGSQMVL